MAQELSPAAMAGLMARIRMAVITAAPVACEAGLMVARDWIEQDMERSKNGVFWPGNRVPSSAPGESPAIQTGDLLATIKTEQIEDGATLEASGGHAHIEIGNARVAPRPFLRPSVTTNKKAIAGTIGQALADGLRGAF